MWDTNQWRQASHSAKKATVIWPSEKVAWVTFQIQKCLKSASKVPVVSKNITSWKRCTLSPSYKFTRKFQSLIYSKFPLNTLNNVTTYYLFISFFFTKNLYIFTVLCLHFLGVCFEYWPFGFCFALLILSHVHSPHIADIGSRIVLLI